MRGTGECRGCSFYVDTTGVIEGIAGFCGWAPTPTPIKPERLAVLEPCAVRSSLTYGSGVLAGRGLDRARLWANAARRINDLRVQQFRGVPMSMVCVHCVGTGVDPDKPKQAKVYGGKPPPDWKHPCPACEARGFDGERQAVA